jgi:hypothetical protein
MLSKSEHILRNWDIADVAEIDGLVANLIGIPKRRPKIDGRVGTLLGVLSAFTRPTLEVYGAYAVTFAL